MRLFVHLGMEKHTLERANKIMAEIKEIESQLDSEISVRFEGKDFYKVVHGQFGDVAPSIITTVTDLLENRLAELEREFKTL